MADNKKLTVLVSSTVYGNEELLDRIYTLLTVFGYEVWMSHKGTSPVFSHRSAFDNCMDAVDKCDLFLGLITPQYGSGIDRSGLSITHKELKKAIALNKPRWLLAHDNVVFARSFLDNIGYKGETGRRQLTQKKNSLIDLRVIDMYEEAIIDQKPLEDRKGNWVQKYKSNDDAALFASAQFSRYQEVEAFIRENFNDKTRVSQAIQYRGGRS